MTKRLSGPIADRAAESRAAGEVGRSEMGQQGAVQAVDHAGPQHDVGPPRAFVGAQSLRPADVPACRARLDRAGDDRLDVA